MKFKMKITTIPQNGYLEHKLYITETYLWIFTFEYFVCNCYSEEEKTIREVVEENYQIVKRRLKQRTNSSMYPKTLFAEINSDE